MTITRHAIERFMQRSGCKSMSKARRTLRKMFGKGQPVAAFRSNGVIHLFCEHRFYNGWVLIVSNDRLITCFVADKGDVLPLPLPMAESVHGNSRTPEGAAA